MRNIIYISLILLACVSCTAGFDDIKNTNNTTMVPPYTLFTSISRASFASVSEAGQQASQYYVTITGENIHEVNYELDRNNLNEYNILRNVEKLKFEAERQESPQYFLGLYHFFRAYLFVQATQKVGDIPYSEALKASESTIAPKYDTQKDIYLGVLHELEEANRLLTGAEGTVSGDIMYGGDLFKWRKLVNTFRLRVLMSLSLKTGDPDLKVIEQFKNIVENPDKYPLMQSNADDLVFKFYNTTGAYHYWYNPSTAGAVNFRLCSTFGNLLKNLQDPRLFKYFSVPSSPTGLDPNDFNSYKSIDHGIATALSQPMQGTTSPINARYLGDPIGVPYMQLGYYELQLILAEAVVRGWITGDAEAYYNQGVTASFTFHGLSAAQATSYLQGAAKFDSSKGLKQIYEQKYIAMFQSSNYETFWNQRRTRMRGFDPANPGNSLGYPQFNIGPINRNDGQIPNRYRYYLNESLYNEKNLSEALSRQQFGDDDRNALMWILIPSL